MPRRRQFYRRVKKGMAMVKRYKARTAAAGAKRAGKKRVYNLPRCKRGFKGFVPEVSCRNKATGRVGTKKYPKGTHRCRRGWRQVPASKICSRGKEEYHV
jgi:hypothetical protein